jgi:integrase/recombinase XerD
LMTGCVIELLRAGPSIDGEQFIDACHDAGSHGIGGMELGRFVKLSSCMGLILSSR